MIRAAEQLGLVPATPRPESHRTPLVDGRSTHPIFNDQPLKLGLFGTNCSNGLTISHAETTYEPTWEHTLKVAQKADRLGFEALVPVARWRGFGSTTNFNGTCFETYTWATGLAAQTENIGIFATSHLPTVHPIVAAKMAVTADHVSRGRFGLNLVMGWFTPEMEMFGAEQREHDQRYGYGQQWIDFVNKLWTEPGSFDFITNDFHSLDVESYPKPYQAPRPALINAGNSKSGIDFSARNVDVNFAAMDTVETMNDYTSQLKAMAREDHQREIQTMTFGLVVCRDTEDEAKRDFQHIVDMGDREGANNVMKVLGMQSQSFASQIESYQERFIAGWGGYPIVGTPEQVADEMLRIHNTGGMNGMIMGMLDYHEEMDYFGDNVMPLLKQAGLRH
ncbi:LLM class flavin-dependent oxidoreductase [Pseudonocardia parietis]|uniref:Alkanesulfonate monooxygenase SsuD/methylene tetrahydromethanopterin reductase-like flavin-dependent oxidoreductase (Luciferase family) n=1 Tax=Pseudonocardia parietis TaxID=570936 RepID=A0ABS4VNW6_9PSEU|nr:LLM class flavin-dependent oxidoreductase [Pseudonocardia parietis]MBP2365605.1 alkanesulfonate monooxygenase SsuD/methylene tetrahydromethanopterin reductase-like flavin-dependent oxidoreductase (luciferase family) [Pseudonocardia parietis]